MSAQAIAEGLGQVALARNALELLFGPSKEGLNLALRVLAGRDAAPTAGIIDSQSVKATESGGPCGYDAGKKTKGRKRHIVTDTEGNLLGLVTQAAVIQDRDGATGVIKMALESYPTLTHIFADGGYAGDIIEQTMAGHSGH